MRETRLLASGVSESQIAPVMQRLLESTSNYIWRTTRIAQRESVIVIIAVNH